MPSCRGVTLCIISGLDSKVYPEFLHPEGSQFQQLRPPTPPCYNSSRISSSPRHEKPGNGVADSSGEPNPYVSVYIPSLSGKHNVVQYFLKHQALTTSEGNRFVAQYSIDPPHTDGRNYFFKLFMNGRHILSWGVDPRTMPVGQAMLGLFEPDKKLKSKALITNPVEIKSFYFKEQKRNVSAAKNGGVIEVKVFRACGKRRRGAILNAFRGQDIYGIE